MSIFLQRYLFEDVLAERVDFVAFHFLAHRLKNGRVGNHQRRHLLMHHYLRLLIQRHPLGMILLFIVGGHSVKLNVYSGIEAAITVAGAWRCLGEWGCFKV